MIQKSIAEIFNLSGKTAIVTGGAMGIGYGIVKRLLEARAKVMIADLAHDVAEKKIKELGGQSYQVDFVRSDVSEEKDMKHLVEKTVKKFGSLDIMVNNAGIFPSKSVMEMDVKFWDKIQEVNMRGVFLGCREAAKVMIAKRGGSIINIASIDALHPSMVGLAAYDASKHGVWGFTKNLALELGKKNIRVNAVAPGGIATEGVAEMNKPQPGTDAAAVQESIKAFTAKIPMGRFGEPDEIALVVLFLASDAASYITGSLIVADGGALLA